MAIATLNEERVNENVIVATWSGMANGDDGAPFDYVEFHDRSVYIGGTFDTSTVIIEGTIDGTNYVQLTDPQGNALSFSAAGAIEAVTELVRKIRPRVTSGGGSTAINVVMLARRPNQ